tara:strand:+ start:346 stop:1476 length:1131 start_codon:yes stop_codon:yes gene_type:complete
MVQLLPQQDVVTAQSLCDKGMLLACARRTWMAEAPSSLEVLLLVDCLELVAVSKGLEMPNAAERGSRVNYTHFPWTAARWISNAGRADNAQERLFCVWETYNYAQNYRKGSVLLRALLQELPRKAYYLKVDTDTLVRPHNLLRFLSTLHSEVQPESRLYFGSYRRTETCRKEFCRSFVFKTHEQGLPTKGLPLRETDIWKRLEEDTVPFNLSRARLREIGATYAQGGAYGLSHNALRAVVSTDCMRRVGGLRPSRHVRRPDIHKFEDSSMGLCAHLVEAAFVSCESFQMYVHHLRPDLRGSGRDPANHHQLREDTPDASITRHPITMHALKDQAAYLGWWRVLNARDKVYEPSLWEWQRRQPELAHMGNRGDIAMA